jgi:hypothetical protein
MKSKNNLKQDERREVDKQKKPGDSKQNNILMKNLKKNRATQKRRTELEDGMRAGVQEK